MCAYIFITLRGSISPRGRRRRHIRQRARARPDRIAGTSRLFLLSLILSTPARESFASNELYAKADRAQESESGGKEKEERSKDKSLSYRSVRSSPLSSGLPIYMCVYIYV